MSSSQPKTGQIALIVALASIFAMLILPISPVVLDMLLMLNIVGTLALLIFSVTVTDSLKLYSFPTLMLITTLYRLGISLSSTRLILASGEAGKIIETFGRTLTSGNLTVGIICFLVLQIIQFLVISKGAERVSEVSARFTLDALPGKQMSIDADLRAGLLSNEEAQTRRRDLIQESKFYGAMDGSMKFVKGETIAGFLIVAINIFGGLAIGVMQRGMELEKAARVYTLLTIGDGLAAQIPALLLSLASGILVTRVGSSQGSTSLGNELEEQLFRDPKKLYIVALAILPLAAVPGFPTVLFLFCATGVALFALSLQLKQKRNDAQSHSIQKHKIDKSEPGLGVGQVYPLLLELSPDLYAQFLQDLRWQKCLNELFPQLQNMLSRKLGVTFPALKIAVNDTLTKERYVIQIYEATADEGFLSPEHCVIRHYTPQMDLTLGENESTSETVHGTPIALLQLQREKQLAAQGHKVVQPEEMLLKHLAQVLKRHANEFIGIQEVKNILVEVEKSHAELVKEVVPRLISINRLTEIVKRLVEENVPIKDFRLILETLAGCAADSKDSAALTELVRNGLKRVLCAQYASPNKELGIVTLNPDWENEIAAHIQSAGGESYLHLPPERIQAMQHHTAQHLLHHHLHSKNLVLITQPETRRYVRKILESVLPDLAVLSYAELMGNLKTRHFGEVRESMSQEFSDKPLRLVPSELASH